MTTADSPSNQGEDHEEDRVPEAQGGGDLERPPLLRLEAPEYPEGSAHAGPSGFGAPGWGDVGPMCPMIGGLPGGWAARKGGYRVCPSTPLVPGQDERTFVQKSIAPSAGRKSLQHPLGQRIELSRYGAVRGGGGHPQVPRHRRARATELSDRHLGQRAARCDHPGSARPRAKRLSRDAGQTRDRLPELRQTGPLPGPPKYLPSLPLRLAQDLAYELRAPQDASIVNALFLPLCGWRDIL